MSYSQSQRKSELILNIAPIRLSKATVKIGKTPYTSNEDYAKLREKYWYSHAFRHNQDTNEIFNIALHQSVEPLGNQQEVSVEDHLYLIARAIQRKILVWLSSGTTILKQGKQLLFWGVVEEAQLLSKTIKELGLEPIEGLEVPVRYEIDCRVFYSSDDKAYLGLVIDVGTSNVIDLTVDDLIKKGISVQGRYVFTQEEQTSEFLRPKFEILGQVQRIEGSKLILSDASGKAEVEASAVYLERRTEILYEVLEKIYGENSPRLIQRLKQLRSALFSANGKKDKIASTLSKFQKQSFVLADGLTIEFLDLLSQHDQHFPKRVTTDRPPFFFGSQGRNRGPYPDIGIRNWGPFMYMQHTRNDPLIAVICEAIHRGAVEAFVEALRHGFPDENWTNPRTKNPYQGGLLGKYKLSKVRLVYEEVKNPTAEEYKRATQRLLETQPELPDIAIIQTRESFRKLYGATNPYYVSKAQFMKAGVPTQAFQIEKISTLNQNAAYILNTSSLAMYAKLDGIPWVIATPKLTTHELVIGIGSTEVTRDRLGEKKRFVGITSVFQGDGRYLVWGLTREVEFEDYAKALLENLRMTIRYVQQHNAWEEGDKVRLVCHVYKRLKNSEVDAVKDLVRSLIDDKYQVEFAFLDISWHHPYYIFDPSQPGVSYYSFDKRRNMVKGKGVPERGLCFQLDQRRGLLHLAGPNELKTDEQGVPSPLLVELHEQSDFVDMTYLLRQIYHFSYMSWRTYIPGTEPVTISYSRLIASLLGNLNSIPEWDSTAITVGPLRDRRWFL